MKNKTRFFIFGQSRSGTGLLVDLLNSHPDIFCERELLNRSGIKKRDNFRKLLIKRYPYLYINHQVNKQKEKVFGFKLLVHQFLDNAKVKTRLFNEEWKIIHIQRRNVLAQTLSGIIAQKTGEYHRYHHDELPDNKTYIIDPKNVVNKLNRRIRFFKNEMELLNGIDHLDLTYENDLANSSKWKECTEKIFRFLDILPVEVTATTLRTDHRTNRERILNYAEIITYLKKNGFNDLIEKFS